MEREEETGDIAQNVNSNESRVNYVFDLDYYHQNGFNREKAVLGLGSGDSYLLLDVLPAELLDRSFEELDQEINWNIMNHKGSQVPRLISIQGDITHASEEEKGGCGTSTTQPLYRHPADEQPTMVPWTPFARICRDLVSERIGQHLNHALIQKYRNGRDNIGEHADKTLDIEMGSAVVNLSIGATRVMILKPKHDYTNCDLCSPLLIPPNRIERPNGSNEDHQNCKDRIYHKITLPHNSVFVLGWQTNRDYLHMIRQDKRLTSLKRADECLYSESRISLTFRLIATHINLTTGRITGQGALKRDRWHELLRHKEEHKEEDEEKEVSVEDQSVRMLQAFSNENRLSAFDWEKEYGCGYSIVNFSFLNNQTESVREELMTKMRRAEEDGNKSC